MERGRWVEVADGVFARRYVELDQTLGLVVGGERCLVVDTGGNDPQGEELAAAVREVTPLPWSVVVTHAHWDHFFGTAAFGPCDVWAHPRCQEAMANSAEAQRADWARRYQDEGRSELADALLSATLVLPDREVTSRVDLDLGGRTVTLLHPGRGHTDNDVVVHVPDVAAVFAGDLVEQGAPPSIGEDAYPLEWPSALDAVLAMDPVVVLPGHGEPVDRAFTEAQRDELAALADLLRAVRAGELSLDAALRRSPYPDDVTRPVLEQATPA
ncbi:Glyoxylase, beta-lactamase superfamily II [Streptoalloteichus tenebrarius]|uniref:Glyoxylase, beta-lactamase superfamily II n=1 Tax=Streptoalloteichus tenebrarius (strain ATCC 17920 / DSM 40477 / JCM 4838 / CBS 697.72 / NBRC 16177 / NCIMB 11028 / NRRL B-12390 / A12253. 1 / ISP 5477) TaxID=1933 RepID=A0ABT1HW31_STRSD|nr:MBL fold metallo-hydrolase [Streptoalloteichus tenebrarius]MCP2259720.1 Glyoxylase, beta-lactamase superfamily II [Streptoalloteichus tenebrarius]BFF00699.1 MBL fold metallo-hydrolase [Streptoalloteichus tenebrarius]